MKWTLWKTQKHPTAKSWACQNWCLNCVEEWLLTFNWVKLDDGKKKKEETRLGIKSKGSLSLDNWESHSWGLSLYYICKMINIYHYSNSFGVKVLRQINPLMLKLPYSDCDWEEKVLNIAPHWSLAFMFWPLGFFFSQSYEPMIIVTELERSW